MGKKYIVEVGRLERLYKAYVNGNGKPNITWLSPEFDLTPYTEPDLEQVRKEAYEEGKKQAKVQAELDVCHDIEKVAKGNYKAGLSDAWEAARKIWKYDTTTLRAIFGEGIMRMDWFMNLTAAEAIEKLKAYEQERDAIKVGDEVVSENDIKAVVIDMDDYLLHVLDENGVVNGWPREDVAKTDRHFPEIATILENMRGEQDG